jgi:hypothetical protein
MFIFCVSSVQKIPACTPGHRPGLEPGGFTRQVQAGSSIEPDWRILKIINNYIIITYKIISPLIYQVGRGDVAGFFVTNWRQKNQPIWRLKLCMKNIW